MFYTYVIQNENGNLYKGHTRDLNKRLFEHNNGKTKSTQKSSQWKIVYFEIFESRPEAIKREKYFKTASGRKFIKQKLSSIGLVVQWIE